MRVKIKFTVNWIVSSRIFFSQKSVDRGDRKTHKSVEEKLQGHLREQRITKSRGALIIARRARLKSLYQLDGIEIENSIRALGYGFIPTQPWPFVPHFFRAIRGLGCNESLDKRHFRRFRFKHTSSTQFSTRYTNPETHGYGYFHVCNERCAAA